jgi:hypothetical protein
MIEHQLQASNKDLTLINNSFFLKNCFEMWWEKLLQNNNKKKTAAQKWRNLNKISLIMAISFLKCNREILSPSRFVQN